MIYHPNGKVATSIKEDYEEEFKTRFIPDLMDTIGDADLYQHMYDDMLTKRRMIRGICMEKCGDDYETHHGFKTALWVSRNIDGKMMIRNIDLLYNEWYNDDPSFKKTVQQFIDIYKGDSEALKLIDEFKKTSLYDASWEGEENEYIPNQKPIGEAAYTQTGQDQVASNMAANNIPEQNIYNSTVQRKLLDLRGYLVSYPYGEISRHSLAIPTVISPERLLKSPCISPLVETTSFKFMLGFNTDYLKYCFDKNAAPNIDNIKEYIDKWESRDGMPRIYSKLYTVFWNLLLVAMDDELYNEYVPMVAQLAQYLSLDEPIMRDLCRGVKYVLSGKELSPDCDLQCETAEVGKFFLHTGEPLS